ncbi:MAG: hypothetical protein K2X35_11560 [Bryobacteraceae bacterium]|nr:hypothetical protein [Bryobacteraceae bacterium]
MAWWSILALAAVTVREPSVLRSGCAGDSPAIAKLEAGTEVTVRFSVGGEDCYKVAAGKLEGYLGSGSLRGLETFDRARRSAAWLDAETILRSVAQAEPRLAQAPGDRAATGRLETKTRSSILPEASKLIHESQPAKALEVLEREMKTHPKDPGVLALAGIAAWRADDPRRALEFWRDSLAADPNPELQRLYQKVEREIAGDPGRERLIGLRVQLRYEGEAVPAETARDLLAILDDEFGRVQQQLGCTGAERVIAIVQSEQNYRRATDAAEWSGGQFDGRIRVPFPRSGASLNLLRRALAHESVHACLATLGRWPAWFHEGVAQKLSGDQLNAGVRGRLQQMAASRQLPRLNMLGQDWSRMSAQHAAMAYAYSLWAIDLFFEHHSQYGIANLVRNPDMLARITEDLDRRIQADAAR